MLERLPEKLRKLRETKGKTLKDVASEIGITGTAISSYEQGNKIPLLSNALKLAEYYGVSIEEMCDLPTRGEARTQYAHENAGGCTARSGHDPRKRHLLRGTN